MRRAAALLAALAVATACGGSEEKPRAAAQPLCAGVPGPTSRWAPVAMPQPVSPEGPVGSWSAEYWEADATMAEGGLCVVSVTDPGTFALTGVVVEEDGAVPGARVSLQPVSPSGGARVQTVTDELGAFAFVNVPVGGERSCYRTIVTAQGHASFAAVEWVMPGEYAQSIDLDLPRDPLEESCTEAS